LIADSFLTDEVSSSDSTSPSEMSFYPSNP